MSPHSPWRFVATVVALFATGCHPTQPFFLHEDGDLSHYLDVATAIDYPDTESCTLDEVCHSQEPLTLENFEQCTFWDLSLEEAIYHSLANASVMKTLGARFVNRGSAFAQIFEVPDSVLGQVGFQATADFVPTVYDPAIQEAAPGGTGFFIGPEAALSAFDAQLDGSVTWQKNDRPRNVDIANPLTTFQQEFAEGTLGVRKATANGSVFSFRNNTTYDANNFFVAGGGLPSVWDTNFEASFNQPLLQGAGTQYNRIAGPWHPRLGIGSQIFDGVVLARINTDIELADFERNVHNLMSEVENAYWELMFAYRRLEATKVGREAAREAWEKIKERDDIPGYDKRRAEGEFFRFQADVETSLTDIQTAENRLRYLMGLSPTDGRLIRPSDEPTTARVRFDWNPSLCEALARSPALRRQKWRIKQREMELIAARNHLLPRLDAVGTYRWRGLGDDWINDERTGREFNEAGSNAFETLTGGDFQEWELGVRLDMPIGFRREMAQVRHFQLLLARDRAVLAEQELELSHQLTDAIRNLTEHYAVLQTNLDRLQSTYAEVSLVRNERQSGTTQQPGRAITRIADRELDAIRRHTDAQLSYYRSLIDYNRAIMLVHLRKGSLLEYNNVLLAEGPWPGKAYFDACREARRRDAAHYMDYGYTRPSVISRGPYRQHGAAAAGHGVLETEPVYEEVETPDPFENGEPYYERERLQAPMPEATSAVTPAARARQSPSQRSAPQRRVATSTARHASAVTAAAFAEPVGGSRRSSQVQRAEHQEPVNWQSNEGKADHATAANSSAASGWKRAQRR